MCGVATSIKEEIESKEDLSDSSKQSTNQYRQAKVIIHRVNVQSKLYGRWHEISQTSGPSSSKASLSEGVQKSQTYLSYSFISPPNPELKKSNVNIIRRKRE